MREGFGACIAALALSGCMYSPASGLQSESTTTFVVSGWTLGANVPVSVKARDYTNDTLFEVGTATSGNSQTFPGSGYFPWSATISASTMQQKHWRPLLLGTGAFIAMGRLELSAFQGPDQMATFSARARQCAIDEMNAGASQQEAGSRCSDGDTLARFDVTAWNNAPITSPWVVHAEKNLTSPTPSGTSAVNVKVVRYAVPAGIDAWAMICTPSTAPPPSGHRLMIYNHGGGRGTTGLDAWRCLESARRGWVFAMTAYRGEPLYVHNYNAPPFPLGPMWNSWDMLAVPAPVGSVEISMGEVMDVHRLLGLMRAQPNVDEDKVFMWGHSHGAGITLRAVESGAQVQAAAAVAPSTDWADVVLQCRARELAGTLPSSDVCYAVLHGATAVSAGPGVPASPALPSTPSIVGGFPPSPPPSGVNATLRSYDWRSAQFFAKDLAIRDDVTLLIQHGTADLIVRPHQSCRLATASFEDDIENVWFAPHNDPTGDLATETDSVVVCPGVVFSPGPRPVNAWQLGHKHFILYADEDHAGLGADLNPFQSTLWADFLKFQTFLESTWS